MDKLEALILQNSKKISKKSRFSIRQIIFLPIKTYSTVLFTILLLLFRFLVQWKKNMLTMQKVTILDSRCDRQNSHGQTTIPTNQLLNSYKKKLVPISTKTNEPRQHEQHHKIEFYYHFFALTNAKWRDRTSSAHSPNTQNSYTYETPTPTKTVPIQLKKKRSWKIDSFLKSNR